MTPSDIRGTVVSDVATRQIQPTVTREALKGTRIYRCKLIRRFLTVGFLLIPGTIHAYDAAGGSHETVSQGQACQIVELRNGYSLKYVRHEVAGAATRLWLCDDAAAGYVDIPSEQIESFKPGSSEALVPSATVTAQEISTNSTPPAKQPMSVLISNIALRYQIDPDFVYSVVKIESGFNPAATSSKGARGLMQIMPKTASQLGIENLFDPAANVEGGTKYLRRLLDLYGGDAAKALAAYNAGPQRVTQYGGVPPYLETRAYVARIISDFNRKKLQAQKSSKTESADK